MTPVETQKQFTVHYECLNSGRGVDWNCPPHITPRFTEEQIREAPAPFERRLQNLQRENQELREAARSKPK